MNGSFGENILLIVGTCEIREDCCWTAKHVGTGSPQNNYAMDEISLLSLSTTEFGHCCQELRRKVGCTWKYEKNRLVCLSIAVTVKAISIGHVANISDLLEKRKKIHFWTLLRSQCQNVFFPHLFVMFLLLEYMLTQQIPALYHKICSYPILWSSLCTIQWQGSVQTSCGRYVFTICVRDVFLNVTLVDIFEALDFVLNHLFM